MADVSIIVIWTYRKTSEHRARKSEGLNCMFVCETEGVFVEGKQERIQEVLSYQDLQGVENNLSYFPFLPLF